VPPSSHPGLLQHDRFLGLKAINPKRVADNLAIMDP
jgi:hypothetical protein